MEKKKYMLTAADVAEDLCCSKQKAYKVIHACNEELKEKGYITVAGKIPRAFWETKMYGYNAS